MDEKQVVKYDIDDATLSNMESIYPNLTITDLEDKEQFVSVHLARMVVRGYRVDLDHAVKKYNDQANQFKKKVKADAAPIYARLEPMEMHLVLEEKKVTDEQKRIKDEEDRLEREKIQVRVDAFLSVGVALPFIEVATMTDEQFLELHREAEKIQIEEQKKLEAEKAAAEAESKRLADERFELDRQKAEAKAAQAKIDREQEEVAAALQAEKDQLAADQKAAQEKIDKANAKIEADRKALEGEKKAEADRAKLQLMSNRFNRLKAVEWMDSDAVDRDTGVIVASYGDLCEISDADFNAIHIDHNAQVEAAEKEAAEKAKAQAEKDAKAEVDREAREKKEREGEEAAELKRQEELRPDKAKLLDYADQMHNFSDFVLKLKNKAATIVLAEIIEALYDLEADFRAKIEGL